MRKTTLIVIALMATALVAAQAADYIGAAKCKMCHKVQYASWAEGSHAALDPQLDCESCHGAGSEYKGLKVMKDPVKAREAGMVMPDAKFFITCHTSGWKDEMLARSHAHKDDG